MEQKIINAFTEILKEELVPAMGCTEPIAVAYAAALAARELGRIPDKIRIRVSPNIIKNVKSVVVPNTGGLRGIPAAVSAGIIAGRAKKELEVISEVSDSQRIEIRTFLNSAEICVEESDSGFIFDIDLLAEAHGSSARCRIAGYHTNVIYLGRDDCVRIELPFEEKAPAQSIDRAILSVEKIVEYADSVPLCEVRETLDRQIAYNMAISEAGLNNQYGACVGRVLLDSRGSSVQNKAKAYAAAASDARMNGCSLPVVINSGSGNQGITASVPVIIFARELGKTQDELYRALLVSNLVTIHLKTGIGTLSAYCGATSAGCGAAAGITYLFGGKVREISHTVVNALAIDSGMICDGAKSSCAAKIASAVEAGLLGMEMFMHGTQFYGGDGIVTKGVENTIRNVGRLARRGMAETDREIIGIMISDSQE